ncbi:MAG: DNA polymerase III subunit gamma/tau [Chloroflexia bacterium]
MAGQVLYRKWRPQRFEEIIGQEHITRTLQRALAAGRIAHAYLFAGPRGTGKTSTARILAKAVNCTGGPPLPCNTCPTCLAINEGRAVDLIEIDGASNRGIDEIRDLREKVRFAPSEARYKVYIIDESHMLTAEAMGALLKTLEEPPPHVIFVLATTEPQRIPPTVLSRCQRFDFRRIRTSDIVRRLEDIARSEGIQATRPALELIARSATGSVRDAESLLDQLLVYGREGTLDVGEVQALLGMRGGEQVPLLVDALIAGDLPAALRLLQRLVDDGVDLRQFNRELVAYLRGLLFLAVTQDGADLLDVTDETLSEMRLRVQRTTVARLADWVRRFSLLDADLRAGWYGQLPFELALVEATLPVAGSPPRSEEPTARPAGRSVAAPPQVSTSGRPASPAVRKSAAERRPVTVPAPPPSAERCTEPVEMESAGGPLTLEDVLRVWPEVVESIRPVDPSVQALLHGCQPVAVEGRIVVLGFRYGFHKGKIEEVHNRRIVEQALSKALHGNSGIRCVLNESAGRTSEGRQQENPRVRAAANIFNARIVGVLPEGSEEVEDATGPQTLTPGAAETGTGDAGPGRPNG